MMSRPRDASVAYRETVRGSATTDHVLRKQTGGSVPGTDLTGIHKGLEAALQTGTQG
ncbi:hypothetical protein [Deinococcus hopiensis]|uniref:hypothetical protein n=1 Tax=Deinococcus hopiensis TaxID=309885 RepID=UPI001483C072|nr:hypothetical protein [Deinococcus hopiensis]